MKCVLTSTLNQLVVNIAYICLFGQKQTSLLADSSSNLRMLRISKSAFIT